MFFTTSRSYSTIFLSKDGVTSIYLFFYISGIAKSRNFIVFGSFLPPYARANHLLEYSFYCCIEWTAGIEPQPPAQQASA